MSLVAPFFCTALTMYALNVNAAKGTKTPNITTNIILSIVSRPLLVGLLV
ncbi:hypothetical protein C427_2388 [Paraglaciecola psychrophila 170]|uniref:Uncharacterized protein n=1 Tax=Paraglaciecola psychrophila 170 TaxID=1129794 RepID=M4S1E3_9ALTE|nr:hypothetical protein C427_2388 [Paraglaciecola psychrophila 170]